MTSEPSATSTIVVALLGFVFVLGFFATKEQEERSFLLPLGIAAYSLKALLVPIYYVALVNAGLQGFAFDDAYEYHLDGIEIAGREGDRISAAADGDVVYAGSDLPAYGELVLVRHANDLVTAYAYTRRALVREGQRVRAGEAIAELGGRADGGARLLFQVRQGSTPVDPAPLLGLTN